MGIAYFMPMGLAGKLTPEQEKASNFLWGRQGGNSVPALHLVAAAGSGKTTTLLAALEKCHENFCDMKEVALITFTRKAASEIRERLARAGLVPGFCGTMHSLAYDILRREHPEKIITVKDSESFRLALIRKLYPEFSHLPEEAFQTGGVLTGSRRWQWLRHYLRIKKENDFCDYEDLLRRAIRQRFRGYRAVFVDEFQDTSALQLRFLRSLSPEKLFLVGDDWQSIYRFRGASPLVRKQAAEHFSGMRTLMLKNNFRSTSGIIRLGNRMIRNDSSRIRKKVKSVRGRGFRPELLISPPGEPVTHFLRMLDHMRGRKSLPVTVLVRTNAQKELLQPFCPDESRIMTIHAAKGLEFDHVCIFGIDDGIFPHPWNDPDEEFRLLYVAITRARDRLFLHACADDHRHSSFLAPLARHCRLNYLE